MLHKPGKAHHSKVHKIMRSSGYPVGGRMPGSKNVVMGDTAPASTSTEPDADDSMPTPGLKSGGIARGKKSHKRLDKLARGGKPSTSVNIVIPSKQPVPVPVNRPVPVPVMKPAGAPVGGGLNSLPASPTGEADIMPQRPMKKGGNCYAKGGAVKMTAGAGSGVGREEKADIQEAKRKGK